MQLTLTTFQERVYGAAKRIPRGRVATYGIIAAAIGSPRAVRAVGNALNKNPLKEVPCHRVVRADGSVGGFARGCAQKITLLQNEGVPMQHGKVAKSAIMSKFP